MEATVDGTPRILALSPQDATVWLPAALQIYVAAMGYPAGTENHRLPMWREHMNRPGYSAFGAVVSSTRPDGTAVDRLVGIAYGYSGHADQWWNRQLRQGLDRRGWNAREIGAVTQDYFELTELHVHPGSQGRAIGTGLLSALLDGRPERRVLLSTPEVPNEGNRAWRLYRRAGFTDLLRDFRFAGDPRQFAVLGHELPLPR